MAPASQFTLPDIGVLSPLWVLKSMLCPVLANLWKFEHSAPPETRFDRVQVHLASQPAICRCGALDAPGSFLSLLNFIYVVHKNKREKMLYTPYAKRHVAEGQQCHRPGGTSFCSYLEARSAWKGRYVPGDEHLPCLEVHLRGFPSLCALQRGLSVSSYRGG